REVQPDVVPVERHETEKRRDPRDQAEHEQQRVDDGYRASVRHGRGVPAIRDESPDTERDVHDAVQRVDGEQSEQPPGAAVDRNLRIARIEGGEQAGHEAGDTYDEEHDSVDQREVSNCHRSPPVRTKTSQCRPPAGPPAGFVPGSTGSEGGPVMRPRSAPARLTRWNHARPGTTGWGLLRPGACVSRRKG